MLQLIPFTTIYASEILGWAGAADDFMFWTGQPQPGIISVEMFADWQSDPDRFAYVLLNDANPVGYGEIWVDLEENELELARILMKPSERGKGLGYRLVLMLLEQADFRGIAGIFVRVFPQNKAALRCYRMAGFVLVPPERARAFNAGQPREYIWLEYPPGVPPAPASTGRVKLP